MEPDHVAGLVATYKFEPRHLGPTVLSEVLGKHLGRASEASFLLQQIV
jgi:hypothetical protein